jgi:2,4-dienoyl-CoA reductase-like NADH-dependent reductase (Old Yellow Enzyme family)
VAPLALDDAGLVRVRRAFVDAAVRAHRLGLDGIELHARTATCCTSSCRRSANQRSDAYGGSAGQPDALPAGGLRGGARRAAAQVPVWVRMSATDWVDGGWDLDSSIAFGQALKASAAARSMHVSSGGVSPLQKITLGPGYQVRWPNGDPARSACRRWPAA